MRRSAFWTLPFRGQALDRVPMRQAQCSRWQLRHCGYSLATARAKETLIYSANLPPSSCSRSSSRLLACPRSTAPKPPEEQKQEGEKEDVSGVDESASPKSWRRAHPNKLVIGLPLSLTVKGRLELE